MNEFFFYLLVENFVQAISPRLFRLGHFYTDILYRSQRLFVRLDLIKIDTGVHSDRFYHTHTRPIVKVDYHFVIRQKTRTEHFVGAITEHVLRYFHHVFEIGVSLIKLHKSKFGIMPYIHTLVTEHSAHFVNLFETAYHETFKIQLGRYAQIHIYIESIVMRDERTSRCTACNGVENGSFDFQKTETVEVLSYCAHYLTANNEGLFYFRICDEVDVTLTIACVRIFKTVKFFGQRAQRLCEQSYRRHANGRFARMSDENAPFYAYYIADIHVFKVGVRFFSHFVLLDVNLYLTFAV